MTDFTQGAIIIYALVQVIQQLVKLFGTWRQSDDDADQAASAERQLWMEMQRLMLNTVLEDQRAKYAAFVSQVQANFKAGMAELTETIAAHMQSVTDARDARLDQIETAIGQVPGAVWEMSDKHLDQVVRDLRAAIDAGFADVNANLVTLFEAQGETLTPALRDMLSAEVERYQKQTERQIDNLALVIHALRKDLKNPRSTQELIAQSEQVLKARTGETNAVADSTETAAKDAPQDGAGESSA